MKGQVRFTSGKIMIARIADDVCLFSICEPKGRGYRAPCMIYGGRGHAVEL